MAGCLNLITVIPAARNFRKVLAKFESEGGGVAVALSNSAQRVLANLIEDGGSVRHDQFATLPRVVLNTLQMQAAPLAPQGLVNSFIGISLEEIEDSSPFYRSRSHRGTHRQIERVLSTLRNYGISPDRLAEIASITEHENYRSKWLDLANLGRAVESSVEQLGLEYHAQQLAKVLDCEPRPGAMPESVLIFEADQLSPMQLAFVRWLVASGCRVTLVTPTQGRNGSLLFAASRRLAAAIDNATDAVSSDWPSQLFGDGVQAHDGTLRFYSYPNRFSEAEWTMRHVAREIANGTQPDRIAIVSRDLESYAPLLDASARRFQVPITLPRRVPIFTSSYAKSIASLLAIAQSDDPRLVIPVAKRLTRLPDAEAETALLERCSDAADRGLEAWSSLVSDDRSEESAFPWLPVLANWIVESRSSARTLGEWASSFSNLLLELKWQPGTANVDRHLRAWNAMQRTLAEDARAHAIKRRSLSLSEFETHALALWESSDASVPSRPMGVQIVASPSDLGEVESLFAIGLVEGSFPRRRREDSILEDLELGYLSEACGLEWPIPDSQDEAAAERDRLFAVCCCSSARTTLSYPRIVEDRPATPAFYLAEVERAAGGVQTVEYPSRLLGPELADAELAADVRFAEALNDPRVERDPGVITNESVKRALAPAEGESFTPWSIQSAVRCGFQYMARDRLALRTSSRRERWTQLRELPERAGLIAAEDESDARRRLEVAFGAMLDDIRSATPDWECRIIDVAGRRLIETWIRREFAARKTWPRAPGSLRTLVDFGEPGLSGLGSSSVKIAGRVAAIYQTGSYNTVHIVRHGGFGTAKTFSEADRAFILVHLLALDRTLPGVALDVETMGTGRQLIYASKDRDAPEPAIDGAAGLSKVNLIDRDRGMSFEQLREDASEHLKLGIRRIRSVDTLPTPGEYCSGCDFSSFCRNSQELNRSEAETEVDE